MSHRPTYDELLERLSALENRLYGKGSAVSDNRFGPDTVDFLATSAIQFLELSSGDDMYRFIAERIHGFVGECIVAVSKFEAESGRMVTHALLGLGKHSASVANLMGGNPVGKSFAIDTLAIAELTSGNLNRLPEGLHSLSPTIPKTVCTAIEKLLDIGDVWSMGFVWNGRLFGNMVILLPSGITLGHPRILETFVRLSSVALQHRQTETALQTAYADVEKRVKQRTEALTLETAQHRKAVQALRESERKYRQLAETAGEIIITLDLDGCITYINRRGLEISGYSMEDALGTNITDVLPEEKVEASKQLLALRAAGNRELFFYEAEIIGKDGRVIPLEASSTLITKGDHPSGVLLTARDITERKKARRALEESENRYRALVDTMNEGLVGVDADWNITFVNHRFTKMIGYPHQSLIGRSFHDLVSVEYANRALTEHRNRKEGKPGRYELELMRSDGNPIFVLCSPKPTYDADGNYGGGFGVISDITDLKRSAEKLQKNEERFKFLAENMADIVWTLDMDFNTTYVSPSVEKILGFSPEERKRQTLAEMVTPESMDRIAAMFAGEVQREGTSGADPDRSLTIEVAYYHRDGSTVWMENSVKAIRNPQGAIVGMYGASRDITERKRAQKALVREKEKLQEALARIKKLSGLLPICASCKKIRDDEGYWNQIESYIQHHSEAEFSHSICPECARKLYPDLDIY